MIQGQAQAPIKIINETSDPMSVGAIISGVLVIILATIVLKLVSKRSK